MEHLSSRLPCADRENTSRASELYFVHQPLVTSGDQSLTPAPTLTSSPASECRISSPWIDLSIDRLSAPRIQAVVRWSERQLLVDQAVLAGAQNASGTAPEPLTRSEFERLAQDYAISEILGAPGVQTDSLSKEIPADLLWLFRHSWQSTRGPFSGIALSSMDAALKRGGENYGKIVIALINRCFTSDVKSLQYVSILDVLGDVLSLDQYRIENLH